MEDDLDEDADLQRAIALSLAESNRVTAHETRPILPLSAESVIDLTSHSNNNITRKTKTKQDRPSPPANGSGHGLLGLDRQEMEAQRLARKRKASISPPLNHKLAKKASTYISSTLLFPLGTVKKTWASGHARADDIKIEEVLQRNDLRLAVLSSFQWDVDWLLRKINTSTKLIFVMQAKGDAVKEQYQRETASMPNLRLCFPSMDGQVNCMHSKLMLLAFPLYLRIVIPTANLVPYDWGEDGTMENLLFIIDLPRLTDERRTPNESLTFFGEELLRFVRAMGLQEDVVKSIQNFDFSATENLAFIHTIGGVHSGGSEDWRRTGYCGLGRAVKEIGLATEMDIEIDFITSSIGSLNNDFITMLYSACQGDDGLKEYQWRIKKPASARGSDKGLRKLQTEKDVLLPRIMNNFRIYFPSHDTVSRSKGGTAGGGTICFQSKWYSASTFPRNLLRDCESRRTGLLTHTKMIGVCTKSSSLPEENFRHVAWAYIGSANCSESAWGKLIQDPRTRNPRLNCRNWECGVLFPLAKERKDQSIFESLPNMIQAVDSFDRIPIPMKTPGKTYGDLKPWFFSER